MFSFLKAMRGQSRPLNDYLTRYLVGTYGMSKNEASRLHFTETKQRLASMNVKLFRVFDPETVSGNGESVPYASLDENQAAVVFEGRYAADGTVTEIKDLRTAQ